MVRFALSGAAALALSIGLCGSASASNWLTRSADENNVYSSTTQLPLTDISGCDEYCDDGCETCDECGDSCHWWFSEAELLVLQYHREDGMRVGDLAPTEDVGPDANIAPRLSFGYITPGGLGVRLRYFEFDQSMAANEANSFLNVDTMVFDAEFFERFSLNYNWTMEGSFGVRYTDFAEVMLDQDAALETRLNEFKGWGLIGGLELRRQICWGALYGRLRHSILTDDHLWVNNGSGTDNLAETIVSISEINVGYELARNLSSGAILYFRTGGEYQLWSDFSSHFDGVVGESFWDGGSDVGLAGVSFATGLYY